MFPDNNDFCSSLSGLQIRLASEHEFKIIPTLHIVIQGVMNVQLILLFASYELINCFINARIYQKTVHNSFITT